MAFDINNLVIDRPLRGVMVNPKTGEVLWTVTQIESPSLTVSADEKTAVDAIGAVIASFDTAKNAEFSGSNSLLDFGLLAAQMGSDKKVATSAAKISTPIFDVLKVEGTTVSLTHTPKSTTIPYIHVLKGGSVMGEKFECGTEASATEFSISGTTITLPTGVTTGEIFVFYEAEIEEGVEVVSTAVDFPKQGKFIMEVLCCDVCDQTQLIHAYVEFPNAKLSSNVDLSFATDGKHPFSLKAQQAYCDSEKKLFRIVVPNEE